MGVLSTILAMLKALLEVHDVKECLRNLKNEVSEVREEMNKLTNGHLALQVKVEIFAELLERMMNRLDSIDEELRRRR